MTLLFLFSLIEMIILVVILSAFLVPLIALIDILRSEFEGNNKLIWVLVVLLFNVLGTLLYFIIGRGQKLKSSR